jgi:hypothetical protein
MRAQHFDVIVQHLLNQAVNADVQMQYGQTLAWAKVIANDRTMQLEAKNRFLAVDEMDFRLYLVKTPAPWWKKFIAWLLHKPVSLYYRIGGNETGAIELKISIKRGVGNALSAQPQTNPGTDLSKAYVVG